VSISASGLELYFTSDRPGGYGNSDLWVTTRATKEDPWGEAVNLGPIVNTSAFDRRSTISANGLVLFFDSSRSGGYGSNDIWMTTRPTTSDAWTQPVNLGPTVNSPSSDATPCISANGTTLYFGSYRPGGLGDVDIWQVSLEPVVDLNGDGIVDSADMCIMVDHWGTDEPLCDIGPMPWGDSVVDVQDLIVLAEHLFEEYPPAESVEVNEDDTGRQVELERGQIIVITLESNPSTGYRWEQIGETEFKPSETGEPPTVGVGGWEIFRFKAVCAGQMTLELVYHRSWEGVEPLKTFSIQVTVP